MYATVRIRTNDDSAFYKEQLSVSWAIVALYWRDNMFLEIKTFLLEFFDGHVAKNSKFLDDLHRYN